MSFVESTEKTLIYWDVSDPAEHLLFIVAYYYSLTTMTSDMNMPESIDISTTVSKTQKKKSVEGRLWETLKALAVTEGNIYFLSALKKLGLSTKDVKFFAEKQVCHKRVKKDKDTKVVRSAMQSKIVDRCMCLRQET